jgi:hypothetical protein
MYVYIYAVCVYVEDEPLSCATAVLTQLACSLDTREGEQASWHLACRAPTHEITFFTITASPPPPFLLPPLTGSVPQATIVQQPSVLLWSSGICLVQGFSTFRSNILPDLRS